MSSLSPVASPATSPHGLRVELPARSLGFEDASPKSGMAPMPVTPDNDNFATRLWNMFAATYNEVLDFSVGSKIEAYIYATIDESEAKRPTLVANYERALKVANFVKTNSHFIFAAGAAMMAYGATLSFLAGVAAGFILPRVGSKVERFDVEAFKTALLQGSTEFGIAGITAAAYRVLIGTGVLGALSAGFLLGNAIAVKTEDGFVTAARVEGRRIVAQFRSPAHDE
jgi:hypothetical protein